MNFFIIFLGSDILINNTIIFIGLIVTNFRYAFVARFYITLKKFQGNFKMKALKKLSEIRISKW